LQTYTANQLLMTISSDVGSSGTLSARTIGLQALVSVPFAALLAANFVFTSVPDYQPAAVEIRIDSVFPRDTRGDRDNIITGSRQDIHYRFRCSPLVPLRIGDPADLLVDGSGRHFSIPTCADHERRAADRARWSAWALCSLVLFLLLSRIARPKLT
jgi:hypothetical protein